MGGHLGRILGKHPVGAAQSASANASIVSLREALSEMKTMTLMVADSQLPWLVVSVCGAFGWEIKRSEAFPLHLGWLPRWWWSVYVDDWEKVQRVPIAEGMGAEGTLTSQQGFVREELAWWNVPRANDKALVEKLQKLPLTSLQTPQE